MNLALNVNLPGDPARGFSRSGAWAGAASSGTAQSLHRPVAERRDWRPGGAGTCLMCSRWKSARPQGTLHSANAWPGDRHPFR